jgi:hypothetical protein
VLDKAKLTQHEAVIFTNQNFFSSILLLSAMGQLQNLSAFSGKGKTRRLAYTKRKPSANCICRGFSDDKSKTW